jgi:hypothetical protein
VNLGIGKVFNFNGYRLESQLQVFNIFNDNTPINSFFFYVDENLEYIGDPTILTIQAPRAAQLLVKFVF